MDILSITCIECLESPHHKTTGHNARSQRPVQGAMFIASICKCGHTNHKAALSNPSLIRSTKSESAVVACDFQQCGILTCVDLDEPVQPPFKLRHSK